MTDHSQAIFRGSIVALVTPMQRAQTPAAALDPAALAALVDFHSEQGTAAIVVAGTTGESATLNHEEHCALIRRVVELAAGRLPVIAGTGANSTTEAIDLTRCAHEAGADACLLVTPYYNKPTQQGLYLHYRAVAEAVDLPQLLYNVPGRTACDLLPETVGRLARLDNVVGLKEAAPCSPQRVADLRALCGEDFALLCGEDADAAEFILQGGEGVISVTANVAPAQMSALCNHALRGDRQATLDADAALRPLHKALFLESNPIPVKWALCHMGLIQAGIRLPLTWLDPACEQALTEAMQTAKIA